MIRYKIYHGKRRDIRSGQARRTHVETQFTVFEWCHQRCTHRHGGLYQGIAARRQECEN